MVGIGIFRKQGIGSRQQGIGTSHLIGNARMLGVSYRPPAILAVFRMGAEKSGIVDTGWVR
jgi:hypothetical protein